MEEITYKIELLDNGMILCSEEDGFAECEKSNDDLMADDVNIHKLIGCHIWNELCLFVDKTDSPKLKLTIKIEKDK